MTAVLSLHGDLRLVSAVNLFQLIKLATLSGHLVVNCAENSSHFIFTEGKLNYGFAREGRKRIGQMLLDSQLITNHQLNSCLTCIGKNSVRAMLVQASWVLIRKDGAPRKWYAIASTGKEALAEYSEDIRQRQENWSYFIARYRKVADPCDLGL